MGNNVKSNIKQYINLLSEILPINNDFKAWIPNCIECLQFALDNKQLLMDEPSLYADTLSTLSLLYKWIFEEESWAYIKLYQKFRKVYSGQEIGVALKSLLSKLNDREIEKRENDYLVSFTDKEGNLKSFDKILYELSQQWKLASKIEE